MVHSQESYIIANFVSKLRTSSPLSCDCLPQEAEFCESDADVTLYERFIESGRCQKIIQCSLDAFSVIRDVSTGYADLHWNPGLKPGDIATFKIIYPVLRSSLDCLLNHITAERAKNNLKLKDIKEKYNDSSTLTFEGLFLLIKTSLDFIHPLAYSCDGVVLSQLINLLDKTSYSVQLANANLSSLTVYLCRLYSFGWIIRLPENQELILRQHSVLFYRVICVALSRVGKSVDPNALLFVKRVIGSILHILNTCVSDKADKINEALVVFMTKFIDVWYGSLVKLLVTIRTNTLPPHLKHKTPSSSSASDDEGSTSESSSDSEDKSDDENSEKSVERIESKDKSGNSTSEDRKSEISSDRGTSRPRSEESRDAKVFTNDKDQLLMKLCKLIYESPKLPPSHRMRLITQIIFVILETSDHEVELEALNAISSLIDFSDEANSSILKSNLLPLLKVLTNILLNRVESSGLGLVSLAEGAQREKYVSLVECLGQVLLNVVQFKYEYDAENVDKFLQDQIKQIDPNRSVYDNTVREYRNINVGADDADVMDNANGMEDNTDGIVVNNMDIKDNVVNMEYTDEEEGNKGKGLYGEDSLREWDQELFEMMSSTMRIFNILLNVNDDNVDEAITQVICWMLTETNFEFTFKLSAPICCVLLRTKNSRMLEAIYGKSGNHVSTTEIALSTGKRWAAGSKIFKTSLECYHQTKCQLTDSSTTHTVSSTTGTSEAGSRQVPNPASTANSTPIHRSTPLMTPGSTLSTTPIRRRTPGVDSAVSDVEMEDNERAHVYEETDTVIKSLFLSMFESYLEVLMENNGSVEEEVEECLGAYIRHFGVEDYLKRMPLEKLYLVPITSERYHNESYCFMLPVLRRQLKGARMSVFPKHILPVLNNLEYFIERTAKLKFTTASVNESLGSQEATNKKQMKEKMLEGLSCVNKLESIHKEYEQVYNELLRLCIPLSCDEGSIEVLTEDNYMVLKYIVMLLDKGVDRFITSCKIITNLGRLEKVSVELIGILVKKFINIEINTERTFESMNMCENILLAIANVSKYCPSDLLSRNLQSFERALNGKRNDALVKLSKSLFPCVSDELKYTMYRNYLTQPKDKFIYLAIRTALETVMHKLETDEKLLNSINHISLNAYKMKQEAEIVITVDSDEDEKKDPVKNEDKKSSDSLDTNTSSDDSDTDSSYEESSYNMSKIIKEMNTKEGKSREGDGVDGIGSSSSLGSGAVNMGIGGKDDKNSDMDVDKPANESENSKKVRKKNKSDHRDDDSKTKSSSEKKATSKDVSVDKLHKPHMDDKSQNIEKVQKIDNVKPIVETGESDNEYEKKFVTTIVRVNGMSELATFLEILTESVDTTKHRINCLLTYSKLLLYVKENLTKVDYSTLIALITKPLIFECVVNCCTKNKNNRSNSYAIFHLLCKLNGNYHHVLKVTLSTLYYNHATNKEGENVNIGIMKLLINIFGVCYGEFDNIETLRLVVYLSGRILQCSFRFYVQLIKFFRVVMVNMNNDHLIQAAPHMMKLFHNDKFASRAKIYIRRLVEKMLIRLKRDHIFSIFPRHHFPLLNNIITTRRRKYNRAMYQGSGGRYRHHHRPRADEEEEDDEDDDNIFEDEDDEPLLKEVHYAPKSKEHLLIRRKAAAAHRLKKKAAEEKKKDYRYIKLNKKGNRRETIKVLKNIIKNKHHK